MDRTSVILIPLLFLLVAPALRAQNTNQPASPPVTSTQDHAATLTLPDSPSPQQNFVLPSTPEAAVIPKPHTELLADHEYTLPELIDIAERENPQTRVAWQVARNAALAEGEVASTYLPVITADVLGTYLGAAGSNSSFGVNVGNTGNVFANVEAVSLGWLLFDFGGRKNITGAARKLSTVSNIAFTGAHQQVIYAVSIAYYSYAAAVQRHHTAVEALANAKQVEAAADARYHGGESTVIETAQSRDFTAQAQLSVVTTQGAQDQAYAALLAAMGISPLSTIHIAPVEHRPLPATAVDSADEIVRDALARRPDVLEAYNTVQASQSSIKAAEAQNHPKIFLAGTGAYVSGQSGLTAIPGFGEQLPTLNITGHEWTGIALLGMSIPIFDAHRRADAILQAKNNEGKAAATLEEVRLNAMREIVAAQISLRTSLAENEAAAALKSAAQTTYDAALDAYKQGVGTVTTAVEAETHLFQAGLAQDDAYTAALSAAVTLAFATGMLGAAPK